MSFLLACPICGPRDAYEFRFGGEVSRRPAADAPPDDWTAYRYWRANTAGVQQEWWFHRLGCRRWFQAVRDTTGNEVQATGWAGSMHAQADGVPAGTVTVESAPRQETTSGHEHADLPSNE